MRRAVIQGAERIRPLRLQLAAARLSSISIRPVSSQAATASLDPIPALDVPPPTAYTPPPPAANLVPRKPAVTVKDARPFSEFLTDTFSRQHTYLRISVTERCNLRCLYCMPEEGVPLSPPEHLLSTPEIVHLANLFVDQGVNKIRLTGGEPTIRKDFVEMMTEIGKLKARGLKELCITSNGIVLARKIPKLVEAGLTGVNLSLDTLDPFKFQLMTRRKGLENVLKSIEACLEAGIRLKVNCVVMKGVNDNEVLDFVEMTKDRPIEVRFIEYMPFDGNKWSRGKMISYKEMLTLIQSRHPTFAKLRDHANDTSKTFQVPGYVGKVGFITSMTHNFCGTCNRLRITSDGNLKVCLFGNAEVSLRDMMRLGSRPEVVKRLLAEEAAAGLPDVQDEKERMNADLLRVIGAAVKGKKAKHAGMDNLKDMKNRPMILIDRPTATTSTLPWSRLPVHFLSLSHSSHVRLYSTKSKPSAPNPLPHLTSTGAAHMVNITNKRITSRSATATSLVVFTNAEVPTLISQNLLKKGDVLSTARIAAIMAAKKTPEIIPLCHPIMLTRVEVDVDLLPTGTTLPCGGVRIQATVECEGKTGVEMEALTACMAGALTVVDMVKKVDRGAIISEGRVVEKKGGESGGWELREGKLVGSGKKEGEEGEEA